MRESSSEAVAADPLSGIGDAPGASASLKVTPAIPFALGVSAAFKAPTVPVAPDASAWLKAASAVPSALGVDAAVNAPTVPAAPDVSAWLKAASAVPSGLGVDAAFKAPTVPAVLDVSAWLNAMFAASAALMAPDVVAGSSGISPAFAGTAGLPCAASSATRGLTVAACAVSSSAWGARRGALADAALATGSAGFSCRVSRERAMACSKPPGSWLSASPDRTDGWLPGLAGAAGAAVGGDKTKGMAWARSIR